MFKKLFWKIALMFAIPWSFFMVIYFTFILGHEFTFLLAGTTLLSGVFAGALWAFAMQYMARAMEKKIQVDIPEGDVIVRSGGANHFKGREGVGGKLVLTNNRLVFQSHKFNIQNHRELVDLKSITAVEPIKLWKLFDTGLLISLNTNERHKFVVEEPAEWSHAIKNQLQNT